jgi:glutaminase
VRSNGSTKPRIPTRLARLPTTFRSSVASKDPRLSRIHVQIDQVVSLIWAASKGDLTGIQRLLASGTDPNGADYDGRTPLHLAASEAHVDVVQYLLAHHAAVNVRDRWGNTPLEDAHRGGHTAVIDLLEKHGGTR